MAGILDQILGNLGNPNPLMQMGLGILSASSRPGQTTGGAIGEGMLMGQNAIQQQRMMEMQQERERIAQERQQQQMAMQQQRMDMMAADQARQGQLADQFAGNPGLVDQILGGDTSALMSLAPMVDNPMALLSMAGQMKPQQAAAPKPMVINGQLVSPSGEIIGDYRDAVVPEVEAPAAPYWNADTLASEFDATQYTPESWKDASTRGDPGLLVSSYKINDREQFNSFQKAKQASVAPIIEAVESLQKVDALLDTEGPLPDVAAITSFTRALDPGSVSQPSEVATVANAPGALNRIESIAQQAMKKGVLTPSARASMRDAIGTLSKTYEDIWTYKAGRTRQEAERAGLPDYMVDDVLGGRPKFLKEEESMPTPEDFRTMPEEKLLELLGGS
jgi:hypothetical protein